MSNNVNKFQFNHHGIIEASAGTGKTHTLVKVLLKEIILQDLCELDEILLITFTKKATAELESRVKNCFKDIIDESSGQIKEKYQEKLKDSVNISIQSNDGFFYQSLMLMESEMSFSDDSLEEKKAIIEAGKLFLQQYHQGIGLEEHPFNRETLPYFLEFADPTLKKWDTKNFWEDKFYNIFLKFDYFYMKEKGLQYSSFYPKRLTLDETEAIYNNAKKEIIFIEDFFNRYSAKFMEKGVIHGKSKNKFYREVVNPLLKTSEESDFYKKILGFLGLSLFDNSSDSVSYWNTLTKDDFIKKDGEFLKDDFINMIESLKRLFEAILPLKYQVEIALVMDAKKYLFNKEQTLVQGYNHLRYRVNKAAYTYSQVHNAVPLYKYKYVFIDEFQDTSLMEWETLKLILMIPESDTKMIVIGDPKQSIFQFKGGDLEAYYKAKEDLKLYGGIEYDPLAMNWRSNGQLVAFFNTLFKSEEFFGQDSKIKYDSVESKKKADPNDRQKLYIVNGGEIDKNNQKRALALYYVEKIKEIKSKNEKASIAILARSNKNLTYMKNVLTEFRIASLQDSQQNIFKSKASFYILLLFLSFSEKKNKSHKIMLFNTPFFKFSFKELSLMDVSEINQLENMWNRLYEMAKTKNWGKLLSMLLYETNLKKQVPKDEFLIYELLLSAFFKKAYQNGDNEKSLLDNVLKEYRYNKTGLENNLVDVDEIISLLTIHKSKGLEFENVFLFTFDKQQDMMDNINVLRRTGETSEITLVKPSLQPLIESKNKYYQVKSNQLTEIKNLFYVALTRVKDTLYLPLWAKEEENEEKEKKKKNQILDSHKAFLSLVLQNFIQKEELPLILEREKLKQDFQISVSRKNSLESFIKDPLEGLKLSYKKENFEDRTLKLNSFTSLSKKIFIPNKISSDLAVENYFEEEERDDFFDLPKGKDTGNCFHTILENLTKAHLKALIELPESFDESLLQMIKQTLNQSFYPDIPLVLLEFFKDFNDYRPILKDSRFKIFQSKLLKNSYKSIALSYAKIDLLLGSLKKDLLNAGLYEAQFYLFINYLLKQVLPFQKKSLAEILLEGGLRELNLSSFIGEEYKDLLLKKEFLDGYIDLFFIGDDGKFYFLDWKTNYLDDGYHEESMSSVMNQQYHLQYKIYLVLSVAFLSKRLENFNYEEHIGGFYYLFVRGISPLEKGEGVYAKRVSYSEYLKIKEEVAQYLNTKKEGQYA